MPENNYQTNQAQVTIAVVTTVNPERIENCLKSLPQAAQRVPILIYVIDNAAKFDVRQIVQRSYPQAQIIRNEIRQSLTQNHNKVLKECRTNYLMTLDDDVELGANCIDLMYEFIERHPASGLTGVALYEKGWQGIVQTAGGIRRPLIPPPLKVTLFHLLRLIGLASLLKKLRQYQKALFYFKTNVSIKLGYICSACCMMRREMLDEIGFFDENFRTYFCDIDLGQRAIKKGWRCYQVPGAKAIHFEAASFSHQTYKWVIDGAKYYVRKHHSIIIRTITHFCAGLLRISVAIKSKSLPHKSGLPSRKISQPRLYRGQPKNILAMKLGGIGDLLMITPALRSLKTRFPQARISLMAEEPAVEVVRGAPYVDELLCFTEFYTYRGYTKFSPFFIQGYKLIKTMLKRRFDIFIEFQSLFNWRHIIKPMLVGFLSRARTKIGFDTDHRGLFLTTKVPDTRLIPKHMVERAGEVVRMLGGDFREKQTEVWVSAQDRTYAQDFFNKHFTEKELVIGIHPGGNPRHLILRSWPEECFSKVADILAEKYQARILLTGGPGEIEYVNRVASLMKIKPLILAGATTVKQLATIIERCHLFISNDTGPMHMAVAMKAPTIGIFGPGDWQMHGTYPAETNFIMLRKPIDCWPCRNLKCTSRACFKLITVDDVLKAVEKQIAKRVIKV